MKTITVEVAQEDIGSGLTSPCPVRPIKTAIARATGLEVQVNQSNILFWSNGNPFGTTETPKAVARFMSSVEDGLAAYPFTFWLEVWR